MLWACVLACVPRSRAPPGRPGTDPKVLGPEGPEVAASPQDLFAVEGDGHLVLDTEAYRRIAAFFDRHLGGAAERELVEVLREFARARGVELAGD